MVRNTSQQVGKPRRIDRADVHVRVLVADDADWVVATDRAAATALAPEQGWSVEELERALSAGEWASDDRWGWGIFVNGQPTGFALVTDIATNDARIAIRIAPQTRGRGVGREVLRILADHHFSEHETLVRLAGRAHEHNIPMQRVFNAAGFKMEARYRDSFTQPDGDVAAEWGYALTRADWEAGHHRRDQLRANLHGLTFDCQQTADGPPIQGLRLRLLQEGHRVIGRYDGLDVVDGEIAGLLIDDLLQYRFVHVVEDRSGVTRSAGHGRSRVQRRDDGCLELVDQWSADSGEHGRRVLVERIANGELGEPLA